MKQPSRLLSKVQADSATRRKPDRDRAMLAVAWAHDSITASQVMEAIGSGNLYSVLARGLRDAVRLGILAQTKKAS